MVLSIPFLIFFLPETKNVPLEEMDRLFAKGLRPWRANKVVMADVRAVHADADPAPSLNSEGEDKGKAYHYENAGESVWSLSNYGPYIRVVSTVI